MKYVPPAKVGVSFNCPYCRALAHQQWYGVGARSLDKNVGGNVDGLLNALSYQQFDPPKLFELKGGTTNAGLSGVLASYCASCNNVAIWVHNAIVYPQMGGAPPPNPDMPSDVRNDFNEAGTILDLSPRGAAALLRLAIQKLCKELGQKGRNIDDYIKALVSEGSNPLLQKALDTVRVIGNEAVHPGQIDLRDDRATAEGLFGLVNLIVQRMISEPKEVDAIYAKLPESKREAIQRRDEK